MSYSDEAIEDALDILAIALPGPRPWTTEPLEAKLRIYRNIALSRQFEFEKMQDRCESLGRALATVLWFLPPPDVTTEDGKVMRFNDPDPLRTLRLLQESLLNVRNEIGKAVR